MPSDRAQFSTELQDIVETKSPRAGTFGAKFYKSAGNKKLFEMNIRPCAFFSMFLVTFFSPNLRGRAEKNKTSKEKKTHWFSVPGHLTDK